MTTELIMIVTVTMAFDLDDLLDALDLELLEELDEEYDVEYDLDEAGIIWSYDEDLDTWFYFDEDLCDWAEIDEDGTVWYLSEDALYYFDDEADDWVEVDESEDDSAAW